MTITDRGISTEAPDPWRDHALCAYYDPDLWFPRTTPVHTGTMRRDSIPEMLRPALRICLDCPVRRPCLAEAIADDERGGGIRTHGIRGGVFWSDSGKVGDPFGFHAAATRGLL